MGDFKKGQEKKKRGEDPSAVCWNMSAYCLKNAIDWHQKAFLTALNESDTVQASISRSALNRYQVTIDKMRALRGKDADVRDCFPSDYPSLIIEK